MNCTDGAPLIDFDARRLPMHPSTALPTPTPSGPSPTPALPVEPDVQLDVILRQCGPIPRSAIFLGMAVDGLPLLLNLHDPAPGPLLIVGDPGSGKRRLLQVVARSVDLAQSNGDVRHAVMTDHLGDWEAYGLSPSCEGILPFHHALTIHYIGSLVDLARLNGAAKRYLVLIVDGLEALVEDADAREAMLWLLEHGPSNSIWPIVAVSTPHTPALAPWLKPFRTVLCGRTSDESGPIGSRDPLPAVARQPRGAPQFALLSGDDWLPFWVPEPL